MTRFSNSRFQISDFKFFTSAILLTLLSTTPFSAANPDHIPVPGKFPPPGSGIPLAGELVGVDHINRRGSLRFDGDNDDDRYHSAPSHHFALLPYGTIRYHGAPAEMRDLPIGTHLRGVFLLPPEGDTTFPPHNPDRKFTSPHNHALTIEDDFSYFQRRGLAWEISAVDREKGELHVRLNGTAPTGGPKPGQTLTIDPSTRIWKSRGRGTMADLTTGQSVLINTTWAPDWVYGRFHAADIWLDPESRETATEIQRQIHIRHQLHRWLPGWVDHVDHLPDGKGIVTLTLFGGMDASLYDRVRTQAERGSWADLAAAEKTLRTWWQNHDSKGGPLLEAKDLPNPPPGSSGLQVRLQVSEVLEGYRPGRIVRLRPIDFPKVKLPPEERVKDLTER